MANLLTYTGALRRDPKIEAWFGMGDPYRLMVVPWRVLPVIREE